MYHSFLYFTLQSTNKYRYHFYSLSLSLTLPLGQDKMYYLSIILHIKNIAPFVFNLASLINFPFSTTFVWPSSSSVLFPMFSHCYTPTGLNHLMMWRVSSFSSKFIDSKNENYCKKEFLFCRAFSASFFCR